MTDIKFLNAGYNEWDFDDGTIKRALVDIFGIRYPIEIEAKVPSGRSKGAAGLTLFAARHPNQHLVLIHPCLSLEWSSRVLYHELTHCYQIERYGPDALAQDYRQQLDAAGFNGQPQPPGRLDDDEMIAYRAMPVEAEAHANEVFHNLMPLTKLKKH